MLYAKYARTGVYMLQDLFRMIGVEQSPEGVAVVRETLSHLHADHPVQTYMRHATDLASDAGVAARFVHELRVLGEERRPSCGQRFPPLEELGMLTAIDHSHHDVDRDNRALARLSKQPVIVLLLPARKLLVVRASSVPTPA